MERKSEQGEFFHFEVEIGRSWWDEFKVLNLFTYLLWGYELEIAVMESGS